MPTITIEEAQTNLRAIVAHLQPGEELFLIDNGQPFAKLVKAGRTFWPCKAGSAQDTEHWMAPDFNAPLDEFKEYMD